MRTPRSKQAKKILQKAQNQTREYYAGWVRAEEEIEKKKELFNHSVGLLVNTIKEKKKVENRPPTIVETIKEVPVEVIKEIRIPKKVEVIKEIIKEVPVVKEVIVEVPKEVVKEVPVEVIKEVIKEVKVENLDTIKEYEKNIKKLKRSHDEQLKLEKLSKKAAEKRYQAALLQAYERGQQSASALMALNRQREKSYKKLYTYAYLTTLYILPQLLWMIIR